MTMARTILLIAVLLLCSVGWLLDPAESPDLDLRLSPPSLIHWAGTDHLGRDVLARTLRAMALAAAIALPAWLIATGSGAFIGVIGAVFSGRMLGEAIDWAIRAVFTTPFFLALVGLGAVVGRSTGTVFLVVVLIGWAPAARYARALARDVLGAPYTRAAYSMGFSTVELSRHVLLPLCLRQVIAASGAIVVEIFVLDFALTLFGFGPPPPSPTLGGLISDGLRFFTVAPWTILTPLLSLCAVCVSLRIVVQDLGAVGGRFGGANIDIATK